MALQLRQLRGSLRTAAPLVCAAVFDNLAPSLISTSETSNSSSEQVKYINDPIWKIITLTPLQSEIINLPLMQRLRRVRQLALAYMVFPSANHSRLEHSIGSSRASQEMFDSLAKSTSMTESFKSQSREAVSLAGLLHDCGHTVFSHVGERILQRLYKDEFAAIENELYKFFPDPVAVQSDRNERKSLHKVPPASELVSALFVLSEPFERLLSSNKTAQSAEKTVLSVCGLIIGRPFELEHKSGFYHFLKSIVSGDLDADKLDYVARDAYFAGLPVAADVHRLLSQLTVANVSENTRLDNVKLEFGGKNPDNYYLLAIRPAAASALEMFVMTRSYLFERIYGHHKVRAAERLLERLLWQRINYELLSDRWSVNDVFNFLYNPKGDDFVLGNAAEGVDDAKFSEAFQLQINKLLNRQLPKRAIAISSRLQHGFEKEIGKAGASTVTPWNQAELELSQAGSRLEVENEICEIAGFEKSRDVYLDWPVANPIRENPEVWVIDPIDRDTVLRVNQYFDAEQLSNAYRDVKQIAWVFSDDDTRAKVAAATALTLQRRYDLLLGSEAVRQAKVYSSEYVSQLSSFSGLNDELESARSNLLCANEGKAIIIPTIPQFQSALLHISRESDVITVAKNLRKKFVSAGLSRLYYDDLVSALEVLKILSRHAIREWRSQKFATPVAYKNESRFQEDLLGFTRSDVEALQLFEVREGERTSGGITDVVFSHKSKNTRPIIVELKSDKDTHIDKLYDEHAGQSSQYAENTYGRISFLYCQFAQGAHKCMTDTIDLRQSSDPSSKHLILCLGLKAFCPSPSDLGTHSLPIK